MKVTWFARSVAVGGVVLMAAACGGGGDGEGGGSTDTVHYLTSFNTFGRDAFAYVAEEKGYFEEAGLDVDIKPGSGTVDVMKLLAGGRADFGAGDFTTALITIAKQKLPVTAVGMVHQKSLAAVVALEGGGIATPKDLEGKTVGDQPGSTNQVTFPVYAKAAGIDAGKVKFVPSAPPALPQLLATGKVDAIGQFVVGKPLVEKAAQGKKAVVLPYGDVLPDLYGNALLASSKIAEEKPELVKKFSAALFKGLRYSIAHPEETGEILKKRQPTQDAAVAAAEVRAMAPYVAPEGAAVGAVDKARVEENIRLLGEAGAISSKPAPEQVVDFGAAAQG
ncbi:ABC transporter substrate-binding protein [Actinomadura sp. NAK00032]|uniref:ABC transporter substrate-binding protein n=1 Tax=Actinomadura sp. NAK00032 TaxID=2742128 RepID=UPI00159129E6|nr:ABC transporter substrate-binding protein [Actinomadura sp. NAK00032]QKW36863.1 ABC transporter substrate-binding protein [Actinomadura sp. NAK00032]